MIGWESPVNVFSHEIFNSIKEDVDGAIIVEIERQLGVEINKDELIKAMNYDRDQYNKGYQDGLKSNAPRWIPCKERMPEDRQFVLFCDIDGNIMIGYHVNGRSDTHFIEKESWEDIKNVRAWMPLPEPYKEEDE